MSQNPRTFDLNQSLESLPGEVETSLTVKPVEHDDERAARLWKEKHEWIMGHVWTAVALIALGGIAWILLPLATSGDVKLAEWARAALSALLAGVISFFLGKAVGKS